MGLRFLSLGRWCRFLEISLWLTVFEAGLEMKEVMGFFCLWRVLRMLL